MKVALNCYGSIPTGLGSEARWLWRMLPFDYWLKAQHPLLGLGSAYVERERENGRIVEGGGWQVTLRNGEIDAVVCVERPLPPELLSVAHDLGIRTVVLANPEWIRVGTPWLGFADKVIARTWACRQHLLTLGINAPIYNIPIDLSEFPFRERDSIQVVRFSNGWGGVRMRKGWPEVEQLLIKNPRALQVYSQRRLDGGFASVAHGPTQEPADLYAGADLMFVPSRYEGIGLTILEAMASGCLVAATDAEPMSAFIRAAYGLQHAHRFLLPVAKVEHMDVGGQPWPLHKVDPEQALRVLDDLRTMSSDEVRYFSQAGRLYVAMEHGVEAAEHLWEAITE